MTYNDNYKGRKCKPILYEISENGCWECVSHHRDKDGYARLTREDKHIYLHRYVYTLEIGEIPEGFVVMHTCDNPCCFNPNHLEIGTVIDNTLDKVNKQRQCLGVTNGRSKLSESDVIEIRNSDKSGPKLAEKYGVSHQVIYRIKNNQRWTHVKEETE